MDIQIFEYYDGYEHFWEDDDEEDRTRVQYFVMGSVSDRSLIICYFGDSYNIITALGKTTHSKAWKHSTISVEEATKCVNNGSSGFRYTKKSLLDKIANLKERKAERDAKRAIVGVDCSTSVSMSEYGISFNWAYGESYTDKFVNELEKLVRMLEIRDEFLVKNRLV
jgi:hypothetical protein